MLKNLPDIAGDIREVDSIPGSGRSPGGRHRNHLQYSCLENPIDRGAWWATVHGFTKSQTRLKPLSTHTHTTHTHTHTHTHKHSVYYKYFFLFRSQIFADKSVNLFFSFLPSDVGSVEGLAYHRAWDTLYWTSSTTSSITRHTVDQTRPGAFDREAVIAMSEDDHPHVLALDECQK